MTIWRMRIARWTPKSTNTHSEYAILTAFALQQWLHERATGPVLLIICIPHVEVVYTMFLVRAFTFVYTDL